MLLFYDKTLYNKIKDKVHKRNKRGYWEDNNMLNTVQVGARLKELRKKSRFTQGQVATYLDVDQSLVSKIEDGERTASSVILAKLAVLFCCSLADLVSEIDYKPVPQMAFRVDELTDADLKNMVFIHKIVMNQVQMDKLLGRINHEL